MPTNRQWLEHTERAAWDSVQLLREKLKAAEKRIEELSPPVEGWPALLQSLDEANERMGLGKGYAAIIRSLLERLRVAEARVQTLQGSRSR